MSRTTYSSTDSLYHRIYTYISCVHCCPKQTNYKDSKACRHSTGTCGYTTCNVFVLSQRRLNRSSNSLRSYPHWFETYASLFFQTSHLCVFHDQFIMLADGLDRDQTTDIHFVIDYKKTYIRGNSVL